MQTHLPNPRSQYVELSLFIDTSGLRKWYNDNSAKTEKNRIKLLC